MLAVLRRLSLATILAVVAQGCTKPAVVLEPDGALLELVETPFFPQSQYQCGPAALAMVLGHAGIQVAPESLVDQVYVPAKRGSFQVELLAATRRHGRLAYVIGPRFTALTGELQAGRPVLVMQNLGWRSAPLWHYAVVIGIDPDREKVILRSGTTPRLIMPLRRFLKTWGRADNWGFVALRADELPADGDRQALLKSIADMEGIADTKFLSTAFQKILERWPNDPSALFGLGSAYLTEDMPRKAKRIYEQLLKRAPNHVPARNNLAISLADLGCFQEARQQVDLALANVDERRYQQALLDTAQEIQRRSLESPKKDCR